MKAANALSHATSFGRLFDHFMPMGTAGDVWTDNRFDERKYRASLRISPFARWIHHRGRLAAWLTDWMRHIPVLGQLAAVYWYSVLDDGTPLPLDALAFSFLNDWHRPSLWHTWYQITHDNLAVFSGIYPEGAPRNRAEAVARLGRDNGEPT